MSSSICSCIPCICHRTQYTVLSKHFTEWLKSTVNSLLTNALLVGGFCLSLKSHVLLQFITLHQMFSKSIASDTVICSIALYSVTCSGLNGKSKKQKPVDICVPIAGSLCCTVETNIFNILKQLYSNKN